MCSFFFLLRVRGFVQERQSIIKYWLDNLRAKHGEVLHNIHFLEGQPISMLGFFLSALYIEAFLKHSTNSFAFKCNISYFIRSTNRCQVHHEHLLF